MKYRIYYNYNNGAIDNIIIEGESIQIIREKTKKYLRKRKLTIKNNYLYSEVVS